jgi:hypothetical protein
VHLNLLWVCQRWKSFPRKLVGQGLGAFHSFWCCRFLGLRLWESWDVVDSSIWLYYVKRFPLLKLKLLESVYVFGLPKLDDTIQRAMENFHLPVIRCSTCRLPSAWNQSLLVHDTLISFRTVKPLLLSSGIWIIQLHQEFRKIYFTQQLCWVPATSTGVAWCSTPRGYRVSREARRKTASPSGLCY